MKIFHRQLLLLFGFIIITAIPLEAQRITGHVPAGWKLYEPQGELWRWRTAYTYIFNGANFDGWEIKGNSEWSVENMAMVGKPNKKGEDSNSIVMSKRQYANFILKLQFSIEPNPNRKPEDYVDSGVFFRVPPGAKRLADEGYEMELPAYDELEEPVGSIRHLARAYPGFTNFNFWNDVEILCYGDYLRVTLNGQIASETFDRRSLKGHIAFQHRKNGGVVRFRNIKIQQLPDTPNLPPPVEVLLENAPGEFVSLFNGRDLTGWSTIGLRDKSKWHVEDGCITLSQGSGPGNLVHKGKFGDFILRLKFYMPDDSVTKDGNSGIFFRAAYDGLTNGMEAQIENFRDHTYWNCTGSIYNVSRSLPGRFKYNDWNEYTVYALGDRIVLYLNGQKTAAAAVPVHISPSMAVTNPGHIKIQSHSPYKKLQVKEITIKKVK